MIVPFSHMSGFIISGYKPLYTYLFNRDLVFTFENYVKCQIHMPVIPELYERDVYLFLKALKFLGGNDAYVNECGEVLKYFYQDMSDMLCNLLKKEPLTKVNVSVEVSFNREVPFDKIMVYLEEVVKELQEILSTGQSTNPLGFGTGVFVKFSAKETRELVPSKILALASTLFYMGNDMEPTILEVL